MLTEVIAKKLLAEIRTNNSLLRQQQKPKWVRASVIMELTGWDKHKMQQVREAGEIVFKVEDSKYLYDLNSLHPFLLKKQS